MKKNFLFMAMAAIVAFAATSCKGGDQTTENNTLKLYPAGQNSSDKVNYGYIDQSGMWVIAPTYSSAHTFSCGLALVTTGTDDEKPLFIDKSGKPVAMGSFEGAYNFCNNYAVVWNKDGKYGMINKKGELVVPFIYSSLGNMSSVGLALASLDGEKYGYINAKNEQKIGFTYEYARDFVDGIAVIKMGDNYGAIDANNKMVISPMYTDLYAIGDDRLVFSTSDKHETLGMMDTKGNVITMEGMYKGFDVFVDNGLCAATMDGDKWGYINRKGDMVISPMYDDADSFSDGYAFVTMNESHILIDKNGNMTSINLGKEEYEQAPVHNGLILTAKYNDDYERVYQYKDLNGMPITSWKDGSRAYLKHVNEK